MSTGPAVSVVIPLYNKASHITRALNSVFAQSVPPSEVIVIDDGSSDGGSGIAAEYAGKGVNLIEQDNRGVSAARNKGISEARGDLVAFLDADDEWLPEHLATVARLTREYPGCGAYAQAFEVVANGGKRWIHSSEGIPAFPWEGVIPYYFRSATTYPIWTSAVVAPRWVFASVGPFPVGVRIGEDLDMWCRIALKYRIAFSTRVGAVYHQEADNRACLLHPMLHEYRFVRLVQDALASGTVPPEQRRDAFEFVAYHQMLVAANNISAGRPRYARRLLRSCRSTRRYAHAWQRLMLQAMLPPGWPSRVKAARDAMRSLGGRRAQIDISSSDMISPLNKTSSIIRSRTRNSSADIDCRDN
jgi:glycosyltransferase involved in cell wall biosynthesis